jgi:hypothetical protein
LSSAPQLILAKIKTMVLRARRYLVAELFANLIFKTSSVPKGEHQMNLEI